MITSPISFDVHKGQIRNLYCKFITYLGSSQLLWCILYLSSSQDVYSSCEISEDNLMIAGHSVNIAIQIGPLKLVTVI